MERDHRDHDDDGGGGGGGGDGHDDESVNLSKSLGPKTPCRSHLRKRGGRRPNPLTRSFSSLDTPTSVTRPLREEFSTLSEDESFRLPEGAMLVKKLAELQRQLRESNEKLSILQEENESLRSSRFSGTNGSAQSSLPRGTLSSSMPNSSSVVETLRPVVVDAISNIASSISDLEQILRRAGTSSTKSANATEGQGEQGLQRNPRPKENSERAHANGPNLQLTVQRNIDIDNQERFAPRAHERETVICGHGTPSWWNSLKIGDRVEARDRDRRWYVAEIIRMKDALPPKGGKDLQVTFVGWSEEWDLWFNSEADVAEMAPLGTHVDKESSCADITQPPADVGLSPQSNGCTENLPSDESPSSASVEDSPIAGLSPRDVKSGGLTLRGTLYSDRAQGATPAQFSLSPVVPASVFSHRSYGDSPFLSVCSLKDGVSHWLVEDVAEFLTNIELPQYVEKIRKASIDGRMLQTLTDDDFKHELGVSSSLHRRKILQHLEDIRAVRGRSKLSRYCDNVVSEAFFPQN